MTTWIPSLITSGVVIVITVSSVIISMRIQLAKFETKFEGKFELIESQFQAVTRDIDRLEAKIDNLNNHFIDHIKNHTQQKPTP